MVSNHLGYLDVLVLASVVPGTFVAKNEVFDWPVIGRFVRIAGTVMVARARRTTVGRSVAAVERVLDDGGLVIVFPEGTSTCGREVLTFKSALLEAALRPVRVWAVHLRYESSDGSPAPQAAYWGADVFLPHLARLMISDKIRARVHCAEAAVANHDHDRKQLARRLQEQVTALSKAECDARSPVAATSSEVA